MKVFDLHCDTLWKIDCAINDGENANLIYNSFNVDFEKLTKGKVALQCFALFISPQNKAPFFTANKMIDLLV